MRENLEKDYYFTKINIFYINKNGSPIKHDDFYVLIREIFK